MKKKNNTDKLKNMGYTIEFFGTNKENLFLDLKMTDMSWYSNNGIKEKIKQRTDERLHFYVCLIITYM